MGSSGCLVFMLWDILQQRSWKKTCSHSDKKKKKTTSCFFWGGLQFSKFISHLAAEFVFFLLSWVKNVFSDIQVKMQEQLKPAVPQRPIQHHLHQISIKVAGSQAGETFGAHFYMNRHANQYLTSISIGKQYFPFYLAIIVLNAVKYLIIGLTAKERPVTMATVKAIGFLFSRIMNFSPLCSTPLSASSIKLKSTRPWNPSSLPYNLPNKRKTQGGGKNVQGSTNASL